MGRAVPEQRVRLERRYVVSDDTGLAEEHFRLLDAMAKATARHALGRTGVVVHDRKLGIRWRAGGAAR